MRTAELFTTLETLFKHKRTVCIESSPGTGKTSIVHQVAAKLNVPCIEVHMPTMLVEDFGIPYPTVDETVFSYKMPEWFPQAGLAPEEGILLFDDRNQANADLQKVLANICQARALHGVPLPDGWQVVSTGNREKDRAGVHRILSHMRNRETVINYEPDLNSWIAWATRNGAPMELVSFMQYRPGLLNDFDPSRVQNATPRSWIEGVGQLVSELPPEIEYECFAGAVGEGPAAEFCGFLKIYRKLPDLNHILANPATATVPSDPVVCYALCGALADKADKKTLPNIIEYVSRMPSEFGVLAVISAVRRDKTLAETPSFIKWGMANKEVVF